MIATRNYTRLIHEALRRGDLEPHHLRPSADHPTHFHPSDWCKQGDLVTWTFPKLLLGGLSGDKSAKKRKVTKRKWFDWGWGAPKRLLSAPKHGLR